MHSGLHSNYPQWSGLYILMTHGVALQCAKSVHVMKSHILTTFEVMLDFSKFTSCLILKDMFYSKFILFKRVNLFSWSLKSSTKTSTENAIILFSHKSSHYVKCNVPVL